MWIPAFKVLKGLIAQAGQFLLPSGAPYTGPYHKYYNGKTYTGSTPSKDAVEIFADDSEPHLPLPEYEDLLVSEQTGPEPEDYDRGYFYRYFVKDNRNGKIIEVKKETQTKKLKEQYLSGVELKWIITKPVKDIFNQGYLFKGSATRNKENVMKANLDMKGLDNYITEFDTFANIESDVEGFKFEELPKPEKIRIIRKISNLQKLPLVKPKPRFKKPTPIKKSVRPFPVRTQPTPPRPTTSSGGGGGGGGLNSGIYDEITENQEQINLEGGSSNNTLSQNNYY